MTKQTRFSVQVPATTANLGPGYDCLGVALQMYNRVTVFPAREPAKHPMATAAAEAFFAAAGLESFLFDWKIEGEVPIARGLGSSVTVRLGLLHGLNALCGKPLGIEEIFALCARLEGHPDNAAPAAFGGFTVATAGGGCVRFDVLPALRFVLLIPDFEVSTSRARKVLPAMLPHEHAARNCASACRIVAAFARQDYALLRGSFGDFLHQPYRLPLVPFLDDVIRAGEEAGALGGFLSGSGSTVGCVTLESPEAVARAMLAASRSVGARTVITTADNQGARIAEAN